MTTQAEILVGLSKKLTTHTIYLLETAGSVISISWRTVLGSLQPPVVARPSRGFGPSRWTGMRGNARQLITYYKGVFLAASQVENQDEKPKAMDAAGFAQANAGEVQQPLACMCCEATDASSDNHHAQRATHACGTGLPNPRVQLPLG